MVDSIEERKERIAKESGSFKVKDSKTGKYRKRRKPLVAFTTEPVLVAESDDIAERSGRSRSEVLTMAVARGLGKVRDELLGVEKKVVDKSDERAERERMWNERIKKKQMAMITDTENKDFVYEAV